MVESTETNFEEQLLRGIERSAGDQFVSFKIKTFHLSSKSTNRVKWDTKDMTGLIILSDF